MNTYCIQYKVGFHTETCFLFAVSSQAAVDTFRANSAASIVAVFLLNKMENWE